VELTGKGNSRTIALTEHQISESKIRSADGREKGNKDHENPSQPYISLMGV